MSTLLGSCIAITMWHPTLKIGGMCHYLLATVRAAELTAPADHAEGAIELFKQYINQVGTSPKEYEVKMFGGGNMLLNGEADGKAINIAKNNITHGIKLLKENGFIIKTSDLGGRYYRKVMFDVVSGDVWLKTG